SFNGRLGARDLLRAVTERPEDEVALGAGRAGEKRLTKERIDVFPDDRSFFGDFEEAAEGGLTDQRIVVWQPLSVAHAWREEVPRRPVLILPFDLVGRWIDLDHSRKWHRVVETMDAVVEDQDVAVRQQVRRMLARDRRRAELPHDLAGLTRNAENGRGRSIAGEEMAVSELEEAGALRPQRPRRLDLYHTVGLGIRLLPRPPPPHGH